MGVRAFENSGVFINDSSFGISIINGSSGTE